MIEKKLPWYQSIRLRIVITAIVVEFIMLSLLLANSYRLVGNALETQTLSRLEALTPLLNASLAGQVFQRDYAEIDAILKELLTSEMTEISYLVIYNEKNELVSKAGKISLQAMPGLDQQVEDALTDFVYDTKIALQLQQMPIGTVYFGLSLKSMVSLRDSVLRQSLVIASIEIVLSLLLLFSAGFLITRHIDSLLKATRRVTEGQYDIKIPIKTQDEIGILTDNFNAMADAVQNRIIALKESEHRFRRIFNAAGDAIIIHDPENGKFIDVNQRMCEMYHCSREQALSLSVANITADKETFSEEFAANMIEQAIEKGSHTFEWMAQTFGTKKKFWVEINLQYTMIGADKRIIALIRDISQRKEAEAEQRLAAISFETIDSIVITDPHGTILRVNTAFQNMSGYDVKDIVGQNISIMKAETESDFYQQLYKKVAINGHWRGEVWSKRRNNEIFPQWLSLSVVKDNHDVISHYVISSIDLTELKAQQHENELRAEEEKVLGKLLRLSLQPFEMEDYLNQSLILMLETIPWLNTYNKGGIFLLDDSHQRLKLICSKNFNDRQKALCSHVDFNQCLCGKSAASGKILFTSHMDDRHEIHYEEIKDHGHFNVPILANRQLLGVIVLYVTAGHSYSTAEESFLTKIADVLGMGISRRYSEAEIEYQVYHDHLTSLPNRRLLNERLNQEIALSERLNYIGAILFIDIDHFKKVNDIYGHRSGDELLLQVTQRIKDNLRKADMAARLGGDEFIILLPALGKDKDKVAVYAQSVAEKIKTQLARPYKLESYEYNASASIGIVLFPEENSNITELLKHADTAMYSAKQNGRNQVHFYQPEIQSKVEERLNLEIDLYDALNKNQFFLYYQPQVDIRSGHIIGAEALIRWKHPIKGFISPAQFIPIADETGQILNIGEWVLKEAFNQIRKIEQLGYLDFFQTISINVSPIQFRKPGFADSIIEMLKKYQLHPDLIKLEITEGIIIDNIKDTIKKMYQLKEYGVKFSLDDFGTGYSSLSYLKQLPLDQLKIDQSFVRDLLTDKNDAVITTTIIQMAHNLELNVIAEGVETKAQLEFLKAENCPSYQGYYFSRPVPENELLELIKQNKKDYLKFVSASE